MEEILALQKQLASVWLDDSVHRLSEGNAVELVSALIRKGMVDLHVTHAREYVTPLQVQREIKDEVLAHGGRVGVATELPAALELDLNVVTARVNDLVRAERDIFLEGGDLIASYHLDSIADEINDVLQDAGQVDLGEISKKYQFSPGFTGTVVRRYLGRSIFGRLQDGRLLTDAFVRRQRACVRGVMSSLTQPTQMSQIMASFAFDAALFPTIIRDLLAAGQIAGTFQGKVDRGTYIPDVYARCQSEAVDSFLSANRYIEYEMLQRLGIGGARDFLQRRYPQGQGLARAFIGPALISAVSDAADEALSTGTVLDAAPLLPAALAGPDTGALLSGLPAVQTAVRSAGADVVEQRWLVPGDVVRRAAQVAQQHIADMVPLVKAAVGSDLRTDTRDADDSSAAAAAAAAAASAEPVLSGKAAKKAARSKKSGKAGKASATAAAGKANKRGAGDSSTGGSAANRRAEIARVIAKNLAGNLASWVGPDAHGDMLADALANHLAQILAPRMVAGVEAAARDVFVDGGQRRKRNDSMTQRIAALTQDLDLASRMLDVLPADAKAAAERYVVRSIGTDLACAFMEMEALHHNVALEAEDELVGSAGRKRVLAALPPAAANPLTILLNATRTGLGEFRDAMAPVAEQCQVMLRALDKRRERDAVFAERMRLIGVLSSPETEQASSSEHDATCLRDAARLLVLLHAKTMLYLPSDTLVDTAIELLRTRTAAADVCVLVQTARSAQLRVESLRASDASDAAAVQEASVILHDAVQAVIAAAVAKKPRSDV